jgi:hypothetical protein
MNVDNFASTNVCSSLAQGRGSCGLQRRLLHAVDPRGLRGGVSVGFATCGIGAEPQTGPRVGSVGRRREEEGPRGAVHHDNCGATSSHRAVERGGVLLASAERACWSLPDLVRLDRMKTPRVSWPRWIIGDASSASTTHGNQSTRPDLVKVESVVGADQTIAQCWHLDRVGALADADSRSFAQRNSYRAAQRPHVGALVSAVAIAWTAWARETRGGLVLACALPRRAGACCLQCCCG